MKKILLIVVTYVLAACSPSAQEKLAQQQLEQIENQKKMVAGFEAAAKEANEAAQASKNDKVVAKKLNLYSTKN
jgi:parvulin-like peptidyl-prolyl isomerase